MRLNEAAAHEFVAAIELELDLESYRERLIPLAQATLSGASRRVIDQCRDSVLSDVWDQPLSCAVDSAIERLRLLLEATDADLARPSRDSKIAAAVVDRVLFELLEHQDLNRAALAELEQELAQADPEERTDRALRAVRGAASAARIPRNEIRAAIVRASRRATSRGLDRPDAADESVRHLARLLATDERREAVRRWVKQMATINAEPLPLLAEELSLLAEQAPAAEPDHDPIWLQACVGMVLEQSLANS